MVVIPKTFGTFFNVTAETIIISTKRSLRCFKSVLSWGYFDIITFVDVTCLFDGITLLVKFGFFIFFIILFMHACNMTCQVPI